jgi:phosphoribosylglycinamide formyltransferase-1
LGILVSGRGSNLQAIIDAIERGDLEAEIALVISNRAGVQAVANAHRHGVPWRVIEREEYATRHEHHLAIGRALQEAGTELVVMAGFDRVLHTDVVQAFADRMINIHPSLLPAFAGGLHAQTDALEYGVKIAGCTAHFVTDDVDAGPIILQAAVPVREDDTAESLAARILEQEHLILPQAIRLIAQGKVRIEGRRTIIDD